MYYIYYASFVVNIVRISVAVDGRRSKSASVFLQHEIGPSFIDSYPHVFLFT
jgi:hypothetical protein